MVAKMQTLIRYFLSFDIDIYILVINDTTIKREYYL